MGLDSQELDVWKSFKQMIHNFLGSKTSKNYANVGQDMLTANQKLGS